MAEIENLAGKIRFAEVYLGSFADEADLSKNFPGLGGVRFECPEGGEACAFSLEAYMEHCEFETYVQEAECALLNMADELRGIIDHRDVLLGGLTMSFPEMYDGETFVGFYESLYEAKKDYDLRTMSRGSSVAVDHKEVRNEKGECIRIRADMKNAYFANRAEVEKWIASEGGRIKNKSRLIREKKELVKKLKQIRGDNHVT